MLGGHCLEVLFELGRKPTINQANLARIWHRIFDLREGASVISWLRLFFRLDVPKAVEFDEGLRVQSRGVIDEILLGRRNIDTLNRVRLSQISL